MKNNFKKVIAGLASGAIAFTQLLGVAVAYNDVPDGSWFQPAVDSFVAAGYLDANQTSFRPGDNATRAEFVKLVVQLNGGILGSTPATPSFTDVATSAWYFGFMEEAGREGWVKGDGACYGTTPCFARPNSNIARAEAAALIVRAFNLTSNTEAPTFVDNNASAWYYNDVQIAADNCVLKGDADTGRARPGDSMNRAEMVAMLYRVDLNMTYAGGCDEPMMGKINNAIATSLTMVEVDFSVDVDATMGADAAMYMVSDGSNDITVSSASVNGSTVTLTLGSNLTPGTTYTVSVTDMKDVDGDMFSDTETFTYASQAQGDGDLEITLSNTAVVNDRIPRGAVSVPFMNLDLTASCADAVEVSRLTLVHEGFGSRSDIEQVFALINGQRVSSTRSIDSDEEVDVVISPPLMVPACGTVQLVVAADIASDAAQGGEHGFSLQGNADVRSNAQSVSMNAPVMSAFHEVASVPDSQATVNLLDTAVEFNYSSFSPTDAEIGDTEVTVADFSLDAGSEEDIFFRSVTFEQIGSANAGDITNLVLLNNNDVIAGPVEMNGDFVTFLIPGDGFFIEDNKNEDFTVEANIVDGATEDVQFELEETSDLVVVGAKYGFGVNNQVYGSPVFIGTGNAGVPDLLLIEAGEFSVQIDGPSADTFAPDTDNVNLANVLFEIGGESVLVNEMWFFVTAANTANVGYTDAEIDNRLDSVELVSNVTGSTESLDQQNLGVNGITAYRLEDANFDLLEEEFSFMVDITDDALAGDQIEVHVCSVSDHLVVAATTCGTVTLHDASTYATTASQLVDAEGATSSEDIVTVDNGTIDSGKTHTIEDASMDISVVSLKSTDSAVDNANDINLFRFEVSAGETNDIIIDELSFKAQTGDINDGSNYRLFMDDGSGLVDLGDSFTPSGSDTEVQFDDFGEVTIPKEAVYFFEVHMDVDVETGPTFQLDFAGATPTVNPTQFISVEDDDGDNLVDADINLTTTNDGTLWTFAAQGNLIVTEASTTAAKQLLGGDTDTTNVVTIELEAEFENIRIEQMNFVTTSPETSIAYLNIYVNGATEPIVAANTSCSGLTYGGGSLYCADEDFELVDDEPINLEIHPVLKSEDEGGVSGDPIVIALLSSGITFTSGGAPADSIEAYGVESDNLIAAPVATTIASEDHTMVFAKIDGITNANADGSSDTTISSGDNPFGVFEFTTADNVNGADVELNQVVFDVIANNVLFTASSFVMYEEGKANNSVTCTEGALTANFIVTCTGLIASPVDTVLEENGAYTFVLQGEVANNAVAGGVTSTLQASINDFTDPTATGFGDGGTLSHIDWTDSEDVSSSSIFWIEFPTTFVKSTSYSQSN